VDPNRLKQAYAKLRSLDERMTHKVRPRTGGGLTRASTDQLEERHRELAQYTIELKEVVQELILAVGSRPKPPGGEDGGTA
jgi:hypothetical protein